MNLRHLLFFLILPGMSFSQPIQITHNDSLYHSFHNAILSQEGKLIVPLASFGSNLGTPPGGAIIAFDTASLTFSETNLNSQLNTNYHYVSQWIYPLGLGYQAYGQALDTINGDVQMMILELDLSFNILRDTLMGMAGTDEIITGILPLDSTILIAYYSSDTLFPQNYSLMELDHNWNVIRSCEPPNTTIIHSMTYNDYTNSVIMLTMNSDWYELDYNSFVFDTLPHTFPTSFNYGGNFITTRGSQGYYQSGYYLNESAHLPNEGWRGACVLRDTLGQIIQFNPVGFASDTPGISAARSVLVNSFDTVLTASLAAPEFATDPMAFPILGSNYYANSWINLCCHSMNGQVHWETRIGGDHKYEPKVLIQGTNGDFYVLGVIETSSLQNISQAIFVARLDKGGNVIATSNDYLPSVSYRLYPNPANKSIHLELNTDLYKNEICRGRILDIHGRVIDKFEFRPSLQHYSIDIAHYAPGAYVIQIEMKNYKFSRKFVVE